MNTQNMSVSDPFEKLGLEELGFIDLNEVEKLSPQVRKTREAIDSWMKSFQQAQQKAPPNWIVSRHHPRRAVLSMQKQR